MNILQILPELKIGGVERGTVDLARYLVKNDHKAVVVSGGGRLVRELDIIGARHYALPIGKKSLINMVAMVGKLCDIIKRENIDIVHARSRVPAWVAYFACRLTGRVFITTAHGYYKNVYTSRVMGWGKFVIVASHIIARRMMDDFKVPYSRIRFIPRGIDLEKFTYKQKMDRDAFTVGVISRLTPIKGHAHFIRALAVVSRIIPKLRVLIIGEPSPGKTEYKKELELLVKRLGLTQIVEFTGWEEDVPKALSRLDLLVLPTVTQEAFGRVVIEAQACGVPVVATRVGGVAELIEDGVNGLLVPAEDSNSIQEAILKVAKDPGLADKLRVEGRKNAEKYSLERMAGQAVSLYKESLKRENILIIKIGAIGDVILSVPSVRAIRAKYPDAVIKVLVGLEARQVFKGCPYIDETIVCDLKGRDRSYKNFIRLAARLKRNHFDIVIDLQNNKRSHLLSFLSFAPLRYGYDNGKLSFLLNKKVEDEKGHIDPVSHQFRTLKLAGVRSNDKKLELWPQDEEEEWAENFMKNNWIDARNQRLVGINPGASKRWSSKNWPIQSVSALCDELAKKYNTRVVVTGTKADIEDANKIKSLAKCKPIVASGKTDILQLAALIKRCSVFITTDSATMHVASAVKTPFVALFGPTEPGRHVPISAKYDVIRTEINCSPCYKSSCIKGNECMKRISVEEVVDSIKKYIKS
jgi:lipopolysaccharide heptosyltransferase II